MGSVESPQGALLLRAGILTAGDRQLPVRFHSLDSCYDYQAHGRLAILPEHNESTQVP